MFETIKIVLILLAIISNSLIGIIAYLKNPKNKVNRTIAVFAWIFALWSLTLLLYDYPIILDSIFWIKVTYIIVVYGIIGALYYFSYIFPTGDSKPPFWGQATFLIFASSLALLIAFTDLFIVGVEHRSWGNQTILNPYLYLLFNIFSSIYGFWGLGLLIKKHRQAQGHTRAQLKYMFVGLSLFVLTVMILDSILPLITGNSKFFSISTTTSFFFVGFTAYAIIKHRLLDIRMLTSNVVVYLLTTFIVGIICSFGAMTYWILTNNPIKPGVFVIILVVSIFLALLFEKIHQFAKTMASKYLFQSIYDYQKTLLDLSAKLSTVLEMPKLTDLIINTLINIMKINRIAVLIRDFHNNHYKIQKTVGFNEENGIALVKDNFLTSYLEKNPQVIVADEMKRLYLESTNQLEREGLKQLYEHMEHIEATLIIPVINAGKMISLIVLGNKISNDPYTAQDINLLTTIASQASVAIENARLYKEVQEFNRDLEDKVRQATEEIQTRNKQLEEASIKIGLAQKVKDDLLIMASHEFRTPLSIINNALWFLNDDNLKTKLSDKEKENFERIEKTMERLSYIVNNLNQMLLTSSGELRLDVSPVQLEIIIKEVLEDKQIESSDKQINLTYEEPKNLLPEIIADKVKLKYVIWELLTNAIKYTDANGKITVKTTLTDNNIQIEVADSGKGIPADLLPDLFEGFKKIDVMHTTAAGMGLGLYIVKKIINLHGGDIKVKSKEKEGSTFTVFLPIKSLSEMKLNKMPVNVDVPKMESEEAQHHLPHPLLALKYIMSFQLII